MKLSYKASLLPFLFGISTAHAVTIGDYTQYQNGNIKGVISLDDLGQHSGDLSVSVSGGYSFDLVRQGGSVIVHLDNAPVFNNTPVLLTVEVGGASHQKVFNVDPGRTKPNVKVIEPIDHTILQLNQTYDFKPDCSIGDNCKSSLSEPFISSDHSFSSDSFEIHIVKKGDTLGSIAQSIKYLGGTFQERLGAILTLNEKNLNDSGDMIEIGDQILIPRSIEISKTIESKIEKTIEPASVAPPVESKSLSTPPVKPLINSVLDEPISAEDVLKGRIISLEQEINKLKNLNGLLLTKLESLEKGLSGIRGLNDSIVVKTPQ